MKNKNLINEVRNLQKIAGLLKEEDNFDLNYNPLSTKDFLKEPVKFYFGYDLRNILKVEDYISANYNVVYSDDVSDRDVDAVTFSDDVESVMDYLEVYSKKLLNDKTFQELVSNCVGKGNYRHNDRQRY